VYVHDYLQYKDSLTMFFDLFPCSCWSIYDLQILNWDCSACHNDKVEQLGNGNKGLHSSDNSQSCRL